MTKGEFRLAIKTGALKCHYCDKLAEDTDHAIPRSRGGRDAYENWRPSCFKCNGLKGSLTEREFLGLDLPIICNCCKPFNTVRSRDQHLLKQRCTPKFKCSCLRLFAKFKDVINHLNDTGCNSNLSSLIRARVGSIPAVNGPQAIYEIKLAR